MKGIILAGGKGTRLHPLTKVTNKHLLPVGIEPMIWHPVKQMVQAGIREVLVITSTEHMGDIVGCLGSGREFGCDFTFKVQEDAFGIAHALNLAVNFASSEDVLVLLGDNIFQRPIAPFVQRFKDQGGGARVLLKEVSDPQRYGVAALDEKHVLEIQEKPEEPKSNFAVVGAYCYDTTVWSILADNRPSPRGEYEITSVNNEFIRRNQLQFDIVDGGWTDAGTFESLAEANAMLLGARNLLL